MGQPSPSDNILFSVLIANYNNGRYLDEAVSSVFSQTYDNWEIVIVDDGSTDNSDSVYEKYRENDRIRIYFNDGNKGCGFTKNRCVALAGGQLCGFLDPDDALLPDALETMVREHLAHPCVSLVFSRFYICDSELKTVSESRRLQIKDGETYFTNKDYSPEHFACFKTECYRSTEGISPDIRLGVDQDLYFKLEEVAPVLPVDVFTYKYRLHSGGISQENGISSALLWNVIVRYETCRRRNLPIETYSIAPAIKRTNEVSGEISRIRNGVTFRIGYFFTRPFIILKKFFTRDSES